MHGSPAAWWQHAGHAALQECRLISRRQAPVSGIAQRRANRQLYQVLAIDITKCTIAVALGCKICQLWYCGSLLLLYECL